MYAKRCRNMQYKTVSEIKQKKQYNCKSMGEDQIRLKLF